MAHGFLQFFDKRLSVFSAGTKASGKIHPLAIKVMHDVGIDISTHSSNSVDKYLDEEWDYVITVCGGANENCPTFNGDMKRRIHIGFDDPSEAVGSDEFILSEFERIRDDIKNAFYKLYISTIKENL